MNALVIDVGATWLRVGRTDGRTLSSVKKIPTPKRWAEAKRQLVLIAGQVSAGRKIDRLVMGLPGTLDSTSEKLVAAPNLPGWVGQPLAKDLRFLFNCAVQLENDVTLNGLGEAVFGAGRKHRVVGFMTLSTGINGTLCIDGQTDTGRIPFELRKLLLPYQGQLMSLGQAISGAALAKKYGAHTKKPWSRKVWSEATTVLAVAVQNTLLLWRPDVLIVGGGLIGPKKIQPQAVRRAVAKTWGLPFATPPVKAGTLGDASGLWGGVAVIKKLRP